MGAQPILSIPPFPGANPPRFARWSGAGRQTADVDHLLEALASNRVGGCYWGRHKALPSSAYELDGTGQRNADAVQWAADDDPWHLLGRAEFVRLHEDDPRALLVLAARIPLALVAVDGSVRDACSHERARLTRWLLSGWTFRNPFTGSELSGLEAIALCGFWRELIDANRRIHSVLGIAYWKKPTVTPLFWAGAKVPYNRALAGAPKGSAVAIWRSRLTASQKREIEREAVGVLEVEDGFLRSNGLGADCVPPLSVIVDELGAHFAPGGPSRLEKLLQDGNFSPDLLERARRLREVIIAGGLSKYETGTPSILPRPGGVRRHVLVPGQVEGDRAVTSGGALSSNLELLRRARTEAGPDAFLIYKPHPDVLAGHRRGLIPASDMAALADHVETAAPMAALIAMVDELHVNSSLAGFEALMRSKPVTVHGVPFYAGWGLTTDLGPVPSRRTARRTLDELVAAALLLYPRYLDPRTRIPAPAEVLVRSLTEGSPQLRGGAAAVVAVRRVVGRMNRLVQG